MNKPARAWMGVAPFLGGLALLTFARGERTAGVELAVVEEAARAQERPSEEHRTTIVHVELVRLPLDGYVELAHEIVHGVVVDQRPVFPEDGHAYTEVSLWVRSAVKGDPPRTIRVRVPGAKDEHRTVRVLGAPQLVEGEEAFFFLKRREEPAGGEPDRVILGLGDGTYRMPLFPEGETRVHGLHARGERSFEELAERVRALVDAGAATEGR